MEPGFISHGERKRERRRGRIICKEDLCQETAGPGELRKAMRLEFFPLVKIEFITIDKENL